MQIKGQFLIFRYGWSSAEVGRVSKTLRKILAECSMSRSSAHTLP